MITADEAWGLVLIVEPQQPNRAVAAVRLRPARSGAWGATSTLPNIQRTGTRSIIG